MFSDTASRRKAILDGNLLPKFEQANNDLDAAEERREQALGVLKEAKAAVRSVTADLRHVGSCRVIACERCEGLVPVEAEVG